MFVGLMSLLLSYIYILPFLNRCFFFHSAFNSSGPTMCNYYLFPFFAKEKKKKKCWWTKRETFNFMSLSGLRGYFSQILGSVKMCNLWPTYFSLSIMFFKCFTNLMGDFYFLFVSVSERILLYYVVSQFFFRRKSLYFLFVLFLLWLLIKLMSLWTDMLVGNESQNENAWRKKKKKKKATKQAWKD